ncbi:MAG: hypothetical protein KGH88_09545 [Thaumarchaeota archaeon]|nr:hypothetical protein [Nitrososphaerota archaeon]
MPANVSQSEMWRAIEEHGIDRKRLEQTEPSEDLILKLYTAIMAIQKKELELRQAS